MWFLLSLLFVPHSEAVIVADLNCTTYNGTAFVYSTSATNCVNVYSDAACNALYPTTPAGGDLPASGTNIARPINCYTTTKTTPAPFNEELKTAAIASCPKTCGYCCQTSAYSCANAQYPSMNCASITNSQCLDPNWRSIIAANCPAACGLCGTGGCVDAVTNCANDVTICNSVGMQDFVNVRYFLQTSLKLSSSEVLSTHLRTLPFHHSRLWFLHKSWLWNLYFIPAGRIPQLRFLEQERLLHQQLLLSGSAKGLVRHHLQNLLNSLSDQISDISTNLNYEAWLVFLSMADSLTN
ncbi:unnamed protein product [Caenorhabditis auriculariae]|uniref:ShKT domain-containing protein n=1 Tax=Caenorhabditis auriculariae TaxID=2777116 RepID=A0A8S1GTB8_9PELO|nr:unnamed protein product [Caenorhabditis auriculariae]